MNNEKWRVDNDCRDGYDYQLSTINYQLSTINYKK